MQEPAAPEFKPLYGQIKELLIRRLAAGEWRPGDALPSETALAREYGVSQGTLRKALNALEAERLVERRQGKGTFVPRHSASRSLFQFFHLVGNGGERLLPESQALSCNAGVANRVEREALALNAGEGVIRIRRMRHLNGEPIISEYISVPARLFRDLRRRPLEEVPNALYELYETRYGVTVTHIREQLRAVACEAEDAKLLGVPLGSPLLQIERTALSIDRQPVEWRLSRCNTRHHYYLNDLG